jgi:hypothetical protein
MREDNNIEIVIRARDEASETLKVIENNISNLTGSPGAVTSASFGGGLSGSGTAASSELLTDNMNGGFQGEAAGFDGNIADSSIEGQALEYEEKLLLLQDYNMRVAEEAERSAGELTDIDDQYSELRMHGVAKEHDYRARSAVKSFGTVASFMQSLMNMTSTSNKKMFKAMQAFNVAQAVMDAYAAFNITLRSLPFPANVAAAAQVLAQGMMTVSQIKSVSPGGGASGGGRGGRGGFSGGGTATSAVPEMTEKEAEKATQSVTINVHNPLSEQNWDAISEDIVGAINKAGERNVELTIKSVEPTLA